MLTAMALDSPLPILVFPRSSVVYFSVRRVSLYRWVSSRALSDSFLNDVIAESWVASLANATNPTLDPSGTWFMM